MLWIAVSFVLLAMLVFAVIKARRMKNVRDFEANSVDAETLRGLLNPDPRVLLYDVRQPLDLLAYSEMIPGARRIPPKEVMANPTLIPADKDAVFYCTCEAQKTSLEIVRHARTLGYDRLKVLRGGLAAWKAKGYPVETYRESFRLDTAG
ncbi:MAG: rhodanese-like domain-containing protein [Acidobacteria bacterium]|nr:rhodanese-like domain-containing protein [Acidobacteriota bacterium]